MTVLRFGTHLYCEKCTIVSSHCSSYTHASMHVLPLTTDLLRAGDNLAALLIAANSLQDGDILILSSKAIAMTEGDAVALSTLHLSEEATIAAAQCHRSPAFCEAVLQETRRLNGRVVGHCPGAILTQLRPDGMTEGMLLVPNAGMDESNIEHGWTIGWPRDPVASLQRIRARLPTKTALIMTDSCCAPRRWGVTAFAIACAGIDPFTSEIGKRDLFGRTLRITVEATADQLAIAGNHVMGNASQGIPIAIIRDHGVAFSEFAGWVNGIEPEKDLFRDLY